MPTQNNRWSFAYILYPMFLWKCRQWQAHASARYETSALLSAMPRDFAPNRRTRVLYTDMYI
eukprot:m.499725 g.499725  ORF g.499725 m.499725 type:complete len:62 (+) comp21828_c0_seq4:1594-1779(+)